MVAGRLTPVLPGRSRHFRAGLGHGGRRCQFRRPGPPRSRSKSRPPAPSAGFRARAPEALGRAFPPPGRACSSPGMVTVSRTFSSGGADRITVVLRSGSGLLPWLAPIERVVGIHAAWPSAALSQSGPLRLSGHKGRSPASQLLDTLAGGIYPSEVPSYGMARRIALRGVEQDFLGVASRLSADVGFGDGPPPRPYRWRRCRIIEIGLDGVVAVSTSAPVVLKTEWPTAPSVRRHLLLLPPGAVAEVTGQEGHHGTAAEHDFRIVLHAVGLRGGGGG